MKVSELITELKAFIETHGDLEVETNAFGGRHSIRAPVLAHKKILKGRESKPEFAWKDEHRGDPVCRL